MASGGKRTKLCPDKKTRVPVGTKCPSHVIVGKGQITCPDGTKVHAGAKCPRKQGKASAGLSTGAIVGMAVGIPLGVIFIVLIGLLIARSSTSKVGKKSSFEDQYTYEKV
jgi:hypothetical protein